MAKLITKNSWPCARPSSTINKKHFGAGLQWPHCLQDYDCIGSPYTLYVKDMYINCSFMFELHIWREFLKLSVYFPTVLKKLEFFGFCSFILNPNYAKIFVDFEPEQKLFFVINSRFMQTLRFICCFTPRQF